jgi:hypothetical protein
MAKANVKRKLTGEQHKVTAGTESPFALGAQLMLVNYVVAGLNAMAAGFRAVKCVSCAGENVPPSLCRFALCLPM